MNDFDYKSYAIRGIQMGGCMKKNIEWINQARGIGMFLVVFGHAMHDSFIRGGVWQLNSFFDF